MTRPILDTSNPDYWVQVYDTTLVAEAGVVPNTYYPISAHSIPVSFNRHTLAIGASSTKTKPTWNLAFWAAMLVRIPNVGTTEVQSRFVRLGLNLIRFPVLAPQFTLKIRIPKWHQEMSFTIWTYVGPESDVLDLLESASLNLSQIESKIDQL